MTNSWKFVVCIINQGALSSSPFLRARLFYCNTRVNDSAALRTRKCMPFLVVLFGQLRELAAGVLSIRPTMRVL